MRILWQSPPPWAPSGYGKQTKLFVPELIKAGHDVAISAYAGVHESRPWKDPRTGISIPILPSGGRLSGNGGIRGNYNRWNADLAILLLDEWTTFPEQFKDLTVIPWMPIDCKPLSAMSAQWLSLASRSGADIRPVAISQWGKSRLQEFAGSDISIPVVPHAFDPDAFYPDENLGLAWKTEQGIPEDMRVVSMIATNNEYPSRKAIDQQMQAFALFSKKKDDVVLYIHAETQNSQGFSLYSMARDLDLEGKVVFADPFRRQVDDFDDNYMCGMYNASIFYTQASMAEGFGVPYIEAMACGIPVVGTNWASASEIITPETGKLVDGDLWWNPRHQARWKNPSVQSIRNAFENLFRRHSGMMEPCIARAKEFSVTNAGGFPL